MTNCTSNLNKYAILDHFASEMFKTLKWGNVDPKGEHGLKLVYGVDPGICM
jgi:hypothetical protein